MKYEWDKREQPYTIVSSSTRKIINIDDLLLENQKLKELLKEVIETDYVCGDLYKKIVEVIK